MPEAPEVRRYAEELSSALSGKVIESVSARTKAAKEWLTAHPAALEGKRINKIFAYGKNIVFVLDDDYYLYSHQMMWGRWHFSDDAQPERDRRERARIVVPGKVAMLYSAPVFEVGRGDPFKEIEFLRSLGPQALLDDGQKFDAAEFKKRLSKKENEHRTIGSALLDQTIVCGIGNYLRAEILFLLRMDPWKPVEDLKVSEVKALIKAIPEVTRRAYDMHGVTVTDELLKRYQSDSTLVYVPGKEYGQRHYVFRRTNLPCLICGNAVRQLRQAMQYGDHSAEHEASSDNEEGEEEKTRIMYFCPECQGVDLSSLLVERKNAVKDKAAKNKKLAKAVGVAPRVKVIAKSKIGSKRG